MFRSKTLFVLGAGAGDDFHFPTGASLMEDIKRKLTLDRSTAQLADNDIHRALLYHVNQTRPGSPHQYSLQDYLEAAEQISFGMPLSASIDTYMDDQRNDPKIQLCGRLAIVKSILAAEHNSKHHFFTNIPQGQIFRVDFDKLAPTWFAPFFEILRYPKERVDEIFNNVSIINFNYDRSLEYFLAEALRTYYNLSEQDAERVLLNLRILHPYGTVAPWHEGTDHLPFGEVIDNPGNLLHLTERIRTYTERSQYAEDVRKLVSEMQTIIFLGFGYIEENLKLLGPGENNKLTEKIYGTAYRIFEHDRAIIAWRLGGFLSAAPGPGVSAGQPRVALLDGKCAQLFDEHRFGIALGL